MMRCAGISLNADGLEAHTRTELVERRGLLPTQAASLAGLEGVALVQDLLEGGQL